MERGLCIRLPVPDLCRVCEHANLSPSSPFPQRFLASMLHWSDFWSVLFTEGGGKKAVEVTNKSTCMTHLLGFKTLYPSFTGPLLLSEGIRCFFLFFQRRMD